MATLTQVATGVNAYFGASDQDAPSKAVVLLAAQSAIDAINDVRRYEPVRLIPEVEDETEGSGIEPLDDSVETDAPEETDDQDEPIGDVAVSVPSVPLTPALDVWDVLEDRYLSRAVRIAVYLCEKEGVDGAVTFSENGVSRSFETGDIPPSMLKSITPICVGF